MGRKLNKIVCPVCGAILGFVDGAYSLRCSKCKAHPTVSGDTRLKNGVPEIVVDGKSCEFHVYASKDKRFNPFSSYT